MSETQTSTEGQRAFAHRSGVSRKLLARKARERNLNSRFDPPVEDGFSSAAAARPVQVAAPHGDQPVGRASRSQQRVRLGDIQPNPGTVVATITAIVADQGEVSRAELLGVMSRTAFPHAAARPEDKGWCQGYVAGAIRNGFLTVLPDRQPLVAADEC